MQKNQNIYFICALFANTHKKIKTCEEYRLWLPIMPTFCGQNVCMSCEWIIDYAKRGRERRGQMDR